MIWTAERESMIDLFMHAPMEEVARHLSRELGDDHRTVGPTGDPRMGYPSSFSFDPVSIARPLNTSRYSSS
jgi:hypothetical protein